MDRTSRIGCDHGHRCRNTMEAVLDEPGARSIAPAVQSLDGSGVEDLVATELEFPIGLEFYVSWRHAVLDETQEDVGSSSVPSARRQPGRRPAL